LPPLLEERAKANDDRACLGRKPSYAQEQFAKVRECWHKQWSAIAAIAQETGLKPAGRLSP
jgi:hypothetical protein